MNIRNIFTRQSFPHERRRFSRQFSITSESGVGGSTLAKNLQRFLGKKESPIVSGGDWMRKKAAELGMEIEEFVVYNKAHPEKLYDHICDAWIEEQGWVNGTIGEGRITYLFMPHACRVKLTCPLQERAHRRASDEKKTFEQILLKTVLRDVRDSERFDERYPGWDWPKEDFDIVVDTGVHSQKDTLVIVLEEHQRWLARIATEGGYVMWDRTMPHGR